TSEGFSPLSQLLPLAFLATTPKFIFVFSSYNNDAPAALLGAALIVVSAALMKRWRPSLAAALFLLTVAGLYTKLTVVFALGAIGILVAVQVAERRMSLRTALSFAAVFAMGALCLSPWALKNYRATHHFFPSNVDVRENIKAPLLQSPLRTLLNFPGATPGEWSDPYAHLWESAHTK